MLPGTTTQDPLAEKYYSLSPYTWCAGNPVRNVDLSGKRVIAEPDMQQIIYLGFSPEEQKYISFNCYGLLNNSLIQQAPSKSENIGALKTISESNLNFNFIIRETDFDGKIFYLASKDNSNYYHGITYFPNNENNVSNNDVYHIIGTVLSEKHKTITAAHEGFAHGYFFELNKNGVDLNPNHTYGRKNDNDGNTIFIKDNVILEDWLKIIINNATNNYEQNISIPVIDNSNIFKWPNQ